MASLIANNLTLRYPIFDSDRSFRREFFKRSVGGTIGGGEKGSLPFVTALENINLELSDGDRLGLIGHNGAGKTTLIKLLGGIFEPTSGTIRITGESVTLVTMGIGLDPDDSGYVNITNCGYYLGMTTQQIEEYTSDIAEFTELGDFLNLPVKTYSTGMVARLTFAISSALAPEIMLMDEGIGAGDARFAAKATARINDMLERCSIMVLASHSMGLIQQMCNKAAILSKGHIVETGTVDEIIRRYDEISKAV